MRITTTLGRYLILVLILTISNKVTGQNKSLHLKYLGVAGWEISNDSTTVLIDPYISRPKLRELKDSDFVFSDTLMIDKVIGKVDFILVTHSHIDHLLDVAYIAKKTGAKVIGTQTSLNIIRAYNLNEDQLYTVMGGEDYQFQNISVKVIPSLHSALRKKHFFDVRTHTEPLTSPIKRSDFIMGGSLMYLLRIGDSEILMMGSMNFIENEIKGLNPDILLAGVNGSRLEIYNYTERLLKLTNYPKIILPTHWDRYEPYEDEIAHEKARRDRVEPFIKEVSKISIEVQVIVPVHLETITIK